MRILCADDQEIYRLVIRQYLRRTDLDIDLIESSTYAETFLLLASQNFDCLLLDYRLGDGNGLDLLRNIRAEGISVPVIVLTGIGSERTAVEFMKAGANDYLPKADLSPLLLSRAILASINERRVNEAQQAQQQAEVRADLLALQAIELQEGRQLLESSISVITEGYVLQNTAGAVILCNKSAEELLGVPPGDVLGPGANLNGWRFIREDASEIPLECRPAFLALITGEAQPPAIIGVTCAGRETKWLSMGAAPLLRAGKKTPYAAVTTFTDVTERRKVAEEMQRVQAGLRVRERAIAATSDSIVICDPHLPDAPIIYCNHAFSMITGYSEKEVIGRNCRFLQGPDTSKDDIELLRSCIRDKVSCQVVLKNYKKDGSPFWNELTVSPVLDDEGYVTHFLGVQTDVTERIDRDERREEALRTAQEQADRDPLTDLLNHRAFQKRFKDETVRARNEGTTLAIVIADLDNFKLFNDLYGHTTGDDVIRLVADRLTSTCRPNGIAARFGGDEFVAILPDVGDKTLYEIEERIQNGMSGMYYNPNDLEANIPVSICLGAGLFPQSDLNRHEVLQLADERLRRAKTGGGGDDEAHRVRSVVNKRVSGFSMLDALVTAVDNKDQYTRSHSEGVMNYCLMIGTELGMDEKTLDTISVAALLHDVGKIGVPDAILRKPGKLTDEEFDAVKQHPQMGAVIVSAVPGLEDTLDAVRHHHERWDGKGYPFQLIGEETPIVARLMAVADAFSAMTTDRPYRQGMAKDKALSILISGAGEQWCPQCVAAFASAIAGQLQPSAATR